MLFMIRTTVYLPDHLHTELKERAFAEKTSMAKIIIKSLSIQRNSFSKPQIIKTPEEALKKVPDLVSNFQICSHGARKGLCRMGCI